MSVNMGLQLFPPPPSAKKKPSRKPSTRRHGVANPQPAPQSAVDRAESPAFPLDGRQSALDGHQSGTGLRSNNPFDDQSALDGRQSAMGSRSNNPTDGRQSSLGGRQSAMDGRASPITTPSPVAQIGMYMPRSQTSFSDAPTLVRSNSNSSHSSIAKNRIAESPQRGEPIIRSIFPRYNPDLPLEHQQYYPTQTSPTHIPKTVISKRPYSPDVSGRSVLGLQSPMAVGTSPGHFPPGVLDETILEPSSTEELKELWKVTNGWRVSSSEGRSFCLKMTSSVESPVHTLSSATQAFYTLRLDPTSTSAQMTMTRLDPNKPAPRESSASKLVGTSKSNTGIEVMSTTLEEKVRRQPPNDGLVALLYPRAASNMAIDLVNKSNRQDEASVFAAAERECGRLVWDEDSKKYYLVHPAVSTPFVVSIASSPAWSRVEYTLEHSELPHNVVRLVRDGAGSGFMEVDTAVAARIDCFYIVDVAICAILLVAIEEEKTKNMERFEAPPSLAPMSPKGKKPSKIEEMELDLESQDSLKEKKEKDKLPRSTRGLLGLIWMLFKFMIWLLTITVKAISTIIIGLSRCLTSDKL